MFDSEIDQISQDFLQEVADFALAEGKSQVPILSGKLQKSIHIEWIKNGFNLVFGDESTYILALGFGYEYLVANGTQPHIITVKNAKVLTNGVKFFGKTVHHPGTKANPFDVRTFQAIQNKFF